MKTRKHGVCSPLCRKNMVQNRMAVLLIAMAAMLMLLGQDKETLGLIGAIMSLLQCVPLLAVPITERALKKRFEK